MEDQPQLVFWGHGETTRHCKHIQLRGGKWKNCEPMQPPPKKKCSKSTHGSDQLIQTSLTKITSPTNMLLKFLRLMDHVQCIAVVCLVKSDQLKICSKHLLRMKAFGPRKIPVNTKPQKVFWMFRPYNKCPLDDILGGSHRPPTVMIYHHIRDPHYLKINIV